MSSTQHLNITKLAGALRQPEIPINDALEILAAAIAGSLAIVTTGGTTTLTGTAAAPQAQNMFLSVTGTLASNAIIEIPVAAGTGRNRVYIIKNGTTGAFTLTVRKVGGTGVTIAQGQTELVYYNETDIDYLYGGWSTWTPTWTNLTVGNGTVTAHFRRIGKLVICRVSVVLGSTSSVSGASSVSFTLPVTSASYGGGGGLTPLGCARFLDASVPISREGYITWISTTQAAFITLDASGTYLTGAALTSAIPFTWTNPDAMAGQFCYEAV